jgi:endonuclease G, mitochondrial
MTNCAPQVSSYNQHGDWGSLETAVATFARGKVVTDPARKLCVISGPVLHPSDPELLGLKVRQSFWKLIAYEKESQLRALAFFTRSASSPGKEPSWHTRRDLYYVC